VFINFFRAIGDLFYNALDCEIQATKLRREISRNWLVKTEKRKWLSPGMTFS